MGITKHFLLYLRFIQEMELIPDTAKVAKKLSLIGHEPRRKIIIIIIIPREHNNKMTVMTYCYTKKSVFYSEFIRDVSSCSQMQLTQSHNWTAYRRDRESNFRVLSPIKIRTAVFREIENKIEKLICKYKRPWMATAIITIKSNVGGMPLSYHMTYCITIKQHGPGTEMNTGIMEQNRGHRHQHT